MSVRCLYRYSFSSDFDLGVSFAERLQKRSSLKHEVEADLLTAWTATDRAFESDEEEEEAVSPQNIRRPKSEEERPPKYEAGPPKYVRFENEEAGPSRIIRSNSESEEAASPFIPHLSDV